MRQNSRYMRVTLPFWGGFAFVIIAFLVAMAAYAAKDLTQRK